MIRTTRLQTFDRIADLINENKIDQAYCIDEQWNDEHSDAEICIAEIWEGDEIVGYAVEDDVFYLTK